MGRHYYTTSCISHLIVSRFKVQVQHVQMAHTLNYKQNGGYECRVQKSSLRSCTCPKFNSKLTHCPAYPIVVIGVRACQSKLGVTRKHLPQLGNVYRLRHDLLLLCFIYIAWITTAIFCDLFIDYAIMIYFIKFIYRKRHNF